MIDIAQALIEKQGLHAASMKQIAAAAGISESQAYNYFDSRTTLLAELAQREFSRIRELRSDSVASAEDHHSRIALETSTYLRHIGKRGSFLQTLIANPEVRSMLRKEHRKQHSTDLRAHAEKLADTYGLSWPVAMGCTVVLWTLCLRAGKVIADGRIAPEDAERLCLSMVLHGSRNIAQIDRDAFG